jgi:hypothetical protein
MAANDWDDGWRLKVPAGAGSGAVDSVNGQTGVVVLTFPYDIAGGIEYLPAASQIIDTLCIVRDVLFAANFSGSVGYGTASGTLSSTYVIDIQDDGVSIGTLTFSTSMVATFATVSGTSKTVAAGSILTLVGEATISPELLTLFYTLKGTVA